MEHLKQKYAPTTAFALSTIYKKFAASKLKNCHDPDVYITYLQDLRSRMAEMNQVVDDRAFMLHILSNLGEDYELVQFHLNHRMFSTTNPLTIEELRHELNNRYDKIKYKYIHVVTPMTMHPQIDIHMGKKELYMRATSLKMLVINVVRLIITKDCCSSGNHLQGQSSNPKPAVANPVAGDPGPATTGSQGGNNKPRFTGTCTYCHKFGHREVQCFSKIRDQRHAATTALAGGNTPPTSNHSTDLSDSYGLTVIESCQAIALFSRIQYS
jgi:gag-polypeptide of LTR copia-type